MPHPEPMTPNFARINTQLRAAFAALDDQPSPPCDATTATNAQIGTDLPGSANGPGGIRGNYEAPGHQRPGAPRVRATHVEVDP